MVSLNISDLAHVYEDRLVFRSVNLQFSGTCMSVTGHNGSGKSTLMRVIAGLLTPVSGAAQVSVDSVPIPRDELRNVVGLVAPDVRLYGELSARENLEFLARARNTGITRNRIEQTLDTVGLSSRASDPIRKLSSGLRQRACFAAAILHDPALLLLDEPTSNLDDAGVQMVRRVIELQQKRGMVIIATNDASEAAMGQVTLELGGSN